MPPTRICPPPARLAERLVIVALWPFSSIEALMPLSATLAVESTKLAPDVETVPLTLG